MVWKNDCSLKATSPYKRTVVHTISREYLVLNDVERNFYMAKNAIEIKEKIARVERKAWLI